MSRSRATLPRAARIARTLYVLAVSMYVILALLFSAVALAQPRTSTVPLPSRTYLAPPSGSSDAVVEKYFDYLALQHLGNIEQTTSVNWLGLMEAFSFGGAFLIILYFFIYAWFARRKTGDLYPLEVYNGYITERNGRVDAFNWALYVAIFVYGVFYIIVSLRFGQIY